MPQVPVALSIASFPSAPAGSDGFRSPGSGLGRVSPSTASMLSTMPRPASHRSPCRLDQVSSRALTRAANPRKRTSTGGSTASPAPLASRSRGLSSTTMETCLSRRTRLCAHAWLLSSGSSTHERPSMSSRALQKGCRAATVSSKCATTSRRLVRPSSGQTWASSGTRSATTWGVPGATQRTESLWHRPWLSKVEYSKTSRFSERRVNLCAPIARTSSATSRKCGRGIARASASAFGGSLADPSTASCC
mmetsp:Transcript_2070/g.4747  ORF Transcript_2070/g.4747 Transcript_2070/m.4747 type:complete len:249 (+) Transcript_2070:474-1220(+)